MAKLGVCGRVAWEREYPPVGPVTAATTVGDSRAAGDGSLVAGEGYGIGPDDTYPGYALRLDRSGDEVWRVQFTPEFYGASFQPRAVVPAANGGHVVFGALKQLNAEFFHGWAAEVTADGEVVWSRLVESGFAPSSPRSGFSDAVRVDGGYLAAGTTDTPSLGRRGWVVGTDETGGVEGRGGPTSETRASAPCWRPTAATSSPAGSARTRGSVDSKPTRSRSATRPRWETFTASAARIKCVRRARSVEP